MCVYIDICIYVCIYLGGRAAQVLGVGWGGGRDLSPAGPGTPSGLLQEWQGVKHWAIFCCFL